MRKLFFDFFPVICFFIAYKLTNFFVATAVIMIAMAIQIGYEWWRYHRVTPLYFISAIFVFIFGGLTIYLHDSEFLQWKVSIVNWLLGAAFLISSWLPGKPIIQYMMDGTLALPPLIWDRLNAMWGLFFCLLGTINLYVMFYWSQAAWVNFKLFGILGLTLMFVILQGAYLYRYVETDPHDSHNNDEA